MISVKSVFQQVPDPRGKQGLQHPLEALLGLIVLSMLERVALNRFQSWLWLAAHNATTVMHVATRM
jgi:hypothetical protein